METPPTLSAPVYALHNIPTKGKGLLARCFIPCGTRILFERPLLPQKEYTLDTPALRKRLEQDLASLSSSQQAAFNDLHNFHPSKGIFGIYQTNALPAAYGESAIFLEASRVNHACDNNAQKHWNEETGMHTLHALRDILEGEEITVYYLGIHQGREARQKALKEKFGFVCKCGLCSLALEDSKKSDERLREISRLDGVIGQGGMGGIVDTPKRFVGFVEKQVLLYREQEGVTGSFDSGLPRAWLDAAQICIANGDLARGKIFAERAVEGWTLCLGGDCKEVLEHGVLARKPESLRLYGVSKKWARAVDNVPDGLGESEFEDWLWMREQPISSSDVGAATAIELVTLRLNRNIFLSFEELPARGQELPKQHWLLLGSIIDTTGGLVMQKLTIEDTNTQKFPIWFYTPLRGEELAPTLVKEGNSVVLLYPFHHSFQYDEPGIRLEDPNLFKIFPLPLRDLLALVSQVQKFGMESVEKLRTCHGCERKVPAASLNRCAKCACFWYCDRKCQTVGWKEKGHKDVCRSLKDAELKAFAMFKWDSFQAKASFPLAVGV